MDVKIDRAIIKMKVLTGNSSKTAGSMSTDLQNNIKFTFHVKLHDEEYRKQTDMYMDRQLTDKWPDK